MKSKKCSAKGLFATPIKGNNAISAESGSRKSSEKRHNAFSVLMTSGKKSSRSNSLNRKKESDFVQCPSCNSSISFLNINIHLDKCVGALNSTLPNAQDLPSLKSNADNADHAKLDDAKSSSTVSSKIGSKVEKTGERCSDKAGANIPIDGNIVKKSASYRDTDNGSRREAPTTRPSTKRSKTNAFNHLMQNSKIIYHQETDKVERQRFHISLLTGKFHVQWMCGDSVDDINVTSEVQWSSTVMIHPSKDEKAGPNCAFKSIELHVSSSIPSSPQFEREPFVKFPSKLSVPVLKSILQKSIRRRRPLPSVRLAMELADKSFGDLIRRLPIICLEDSFLHQDFPLLCWLMCAESKNFVAPRALMERIMCIVFEIASCPWKDTTDNEIDEGNNALFSLHTSFNMELFNVPDVDQCDLMLRSLVLRKKYGGMACDKRMISNFVLLWSRRYNNLKLDADIVAKMFPNLKREVMWKEVPFLLNSCYNKTSAVQDLLSTQLPFLKLHDMCPSGVDFHCSNVIDFLVNKENSTSLFSKLHNYLATDSQESERKLLQKMMWDYSSGINHRRCFTGFNKKETNRTSKLDCDLKNIWDEEVYPLFKVFVDAYLSARLVLA